MTQIEDIIAKAAAWALCADAKGAGPGKCDHEHCTCGNEGRVVTPAILSALAAAGFVVVPKEPNLAMQNAGWREVDKQGFSTEDTEVAPIYRAMIEARPK